MQSFSLGLLSATFGGRGGDRAWRQENAAVGQRGRVFWSVLTAVCLFTALSIGLHPATAAAQNPIVLENQQPGTIAWQLSNRVGNDTTGQIKGYASAPSVNRGDNITFYVSTNPAQTFTMDVYRIGWYQGLGGRLMQHVDPLNAITQPRCPSNPTTGMIECNWAPSYALTTQGSWTSGVYIVVLTNGQGYQNYMIFVVRDDSRVAPLLYNQPVTTYQAYNNYPNDNATGKSLYEYNSYGSSVPATGTTRAAKVSFDRPYLDAGTNDFWTTGEINFIRWMERSGYDVTYATDIETHTNGYRLLYYRGFLSVGHDEYWSKPMYDAAVTARDAGVNLGFFGADAVYWQIRFENSSSGVPNRVVVCYKDDVRDPVADPTLKTILWRDPPLSRPEQTLVGVQYTSMPPYNNGYYAPYVVTNSNNWVYAGTGFKDGDAAPALVGYEADRLFSDYPGPDAVAGTYTLLSHSPYQSVQGPDYGNSSIYQAPSGAWVFGSGSMNWNWGLDSYPYGVDLGQFPANVVDPRIQRATANILDRFIAGALPDFTVTASPTSQTVLQGASGSYTLTINPTNGFTGGVTLSVAGLPTGATGTFTPNPATASSTLSVTTSLSTPAGTYTLTVTGVSGSLNGTTTVSLSVVATLPPAGVAFDAVGPSSGGASVLSGSSLSWSHTVTANGSNLLLMVSVAVGTSPDTGKSLAVTYNGVPMTSVGIVHSNNQTAGFVQLFYLKAPAAGTHPVQVTLSGGTASLEGGSLSFTGVDQTTPVRNIATNFGTGGSPNVTVTSTSGNMVVDALVTGCNGDIISGKTLRWLNQVNCATAGGNGAQSTAAGAGSVTMGYTVPSDWWGMIGADIVAAGGQSAPIDFTLSNEGNKSVAQGSAVTNTVTATLSSGIAQSVAFSASGLPTGVTASFNPTSCLPTCSTTLTISAGTSAALGTWPITLTATAGSVSRTTTFTLTVTASITPDFSLSATPTSQTVLPGASGSYTLAINPTNGFTGGVTLSVAGLPTGATATFTPNPATASSTLSVTTSLSTPAGTYTLTVTGVSGTLTHTTTVSLTVSGGGITVTAPNTAVSWKVTSQQNITFTHSLGVGQPVNIEVSRDGGSTWSLITVFTTTSATSGSYSWAVTGPATTRARIRVGSVTNPLASDMSDLDFTISNPTITVTSPNTAVSWRAGDTKNITFSHTMGVGQTVNIDVSRDGGATWSFISTFTTTSATSGSYAWVVSGPETQHAMIRVSWTVDPVVTDTSDVQFTILPRTTVTAPNTAVSWGAGSTRQITWNHNLGVGGLVDIAFSPDNGVTWVPLAQGVASGAATTGSYTTPMPTTLTTQALIRVVPSIDPTLGDVSDVPFTLAAPTITVTAPNTSTTWGIGSSQNIKWKHNLGTGESVRIELARDGVNYTETLAASAVNTANTSGTFSWVITGPATTTARIRVTWVANGAVTDTSNVNFTIR